MNSFPQWYVSPDRLPEFLTRGYRARYFFSHHIHYLPRAGPSHMFLSKNMCGKARPSKFWEVLLFASQPTLDAFPPELFFDNDLVWHREQMGQPGHIAFATITVQGPQVYGLNYVADVVQRIARRPEFRTRIAKLFKGWSRMLFNGIMNFAHERGIRYFYSPTADLIIANIDPKRAVQRDLFERVYDKTLTQYFPADRRGKWWVVDVEQNKERIVRPERRTIRLPCDKTICIFHDIERGLGHRRIDMKLATLANANAPATISAMLRTEKAANIKTTYNVVGSFFNEVRQDIEENGHCLAFHSYDHKIDHWWPISKLLSGKDQLDKLRDVDFHVRGFRPPQSRQTLEISDWRLCRYGFNWLASSLQKLRSCSPRVQNRLVKIPILLDDFLLYKKRIPFAYWEKTAIELIENNHFVTIGLHDCYAQFWQHHYISFLEKVKQYGVFKTFDQVADETFLSSGY